MPTLPKGNNRPWIPKRPQHMREVDNASFYNSMRWRKVRKYFLKRNPICRICEYEGKIKSATVVDHIRPITMGGKEFDIKNLQSLCESHHNAKSAREGHERRKVKTYKRTR
tara:strand:+ start:1329 stop:1661 length:333 start_codon:yes stop_codon:yes gene_type:complete